MAKTKNKKRLSSDRIHSKKEKASLKKQLNPFEVHINKEKIRVLGKKQKNDKGLPGVSRGKAIEKRKSTLLREYKQQNKSNKFFDKRIGEKNHNMTKDDKTMARFTAVRVKAHNKKSIFNLADDEVLTHRGQTLSEIEKFDDPRSEDEESLEENETGKLDSSFVGEAHFGGGMLKKTGTGAKSHKDLIEQLITESKKRKAEKQKTKEATLELTEKLDTEWKDLLPLVSKSNKIEETDQKRPAVDDYDKVMRELRFEARGTVSDRLKTVDELAKEEKEKLESLEKERLERMKGFVDVPSTKANHRSADDLDDNIVYESDPEYMLSYNAEGESNVPIDISVEKTKDNSSDDEIDENTDEEVEEDESDSEDDLDDLKGEASASETDIEEVYDAVKENVTVVPEYSEKETESSQIVLQNENGKEKIKNDLLERKKIMEQARKELPYTFSLPESYESLQSILENQPSNYQHVIIERMIKCNHPSLAEGNKDKLGLLFAYLLQYINDLFVDCCEETSIKNSFEIFKYLVPQIYELAQLNPENAHNSLLEVIKEKHEEFKEHSTKYPGLEVLVFLKLVSVLFSTSDFRHQVVTPCFVFMDQMLTKCRVRNKKDISYGLFISTLVLEYTTISKRFMPATITFLAGLLHMAIPKTGVRLVKVLPPFKATSSLLVLTEPVSSNVCECFQMNSHDLLNSAINDNYKLRVLFNTLKLLEEFHNNLLELPSNVEIFQAVKRYVSLIPTTNYPKEVKEALEQFSNTLKMTEQNKTFNYIVMEASKPKALRLYEPKIFAIYDGKRHKVQSKEKAEQEKLLHKLKKEQKGVLREIRRDIAFLGRVKIQQQLRSDKERREKVKRIYAEATTQQSELNALDRKKKRKK